MINIVCTYFEGRNVPAHSKDVFTPEWVDKLYRGIERNLADRFNFVVVTDEPKSSFAEPIEVLSFKKYRHNRWCIIECLRVPDALFMGLDTIITGDISEIAKFKTEFSMIRAPYNEKRMCSGVMMWKDKKNLYDRFVKDKGKQDYTDYGSPSCMEWLEQYGEPNDLDKEFPGQIRSYKAHILQTGIGDARIVYFHGEHKPHEIEHTILDHWI